RAHDPDTMRFVESEDLCQVRSQIFDVVAGAAHAELAKVPKVFSYLCGIQIELLGQLLRRNGLDSGRRQFIKTAQIYAQAISRQLRNLFSLHGEPEKYNADTTERKATGLRLKTYLRDNPRRVTEPRTIVSGWRNAGRMPANRRQGCLRSVMI